MGRVMTRRRFLVGAGSAGALAVGGGGAIAVTRPHTMRRFLHARGLLGGPDARIPDATADVQFGEIDSAAVRRRVGYGMSLPSAPAQGALICLHGRGGTHRDPFDDLGVHRFVAAAGLPLAVASVDGGESFWHARADGTDTQKLVLDELVPLVHRSAPGAALVVIGWSMGAYGALLMAEQHPGTFRAVVASSPSLWRTPGESAGGAFDDADDFARNDVLGHAAALVGADTRVDCGDDDVFADACRDLVRSVPGAAGGVRAGYHESPTWRSFLPDQLEFVRSRLS
jgi:pimeloyl-ACP methyl ester carboxylesterase